MGSGKTLLDVDLFWVAEDEEEEDVDEDNDKDRCGGW